MTSVLLSPHHDDETLFAAFTIMREEPRVIVALESHLQAKRGNLWGNLLITNEMRQWETRRALAELRAARGSWLPDANSDERLRLEFWQFRDDAPDWARIRFAIESIDCDVLYAPAPSFHGHEHHNQIGALAQKTHSNVMLYGTYERGTPDERMTGSYEVPHEPWMVLAKLRALACYHSQIGLWPHHFLAEQREYYA